MTIIDLAKFGPWIEVWRRRRLLLQTDDGPLLLALPTGKMSVSKSGRRKSIVFGSASRSAVQIIGSAATIDAIANQILTNERSGFVTKIANTK